jgi:HEAT repeat protein
MNPRLAAVTALVGLTFWFVSPAATQDWASLDEQTLKAAAIATDTPALLKFLAERTLREEARSAITGQIKQLDSENYEDRAAANQALLSHGFRSVPLLKAALGANPSLETRRRAEDLIRKLDTAANRDNTVAAARLLAARQANGAIDVLLRYLPDVDDPWVEDEILVCLGRLAIRQGEPDARLLAALKDPLPVRRGAVIYLLGRRANVGQRGLVRSFLVDRDPLLRERAVQGLVGKHALETQRDAGPADQTTLKNNHLAVTEEALLAFLRKRTPGLADQARLAALVTQIGSFDSQERDTASRALVDAGTCALAFLRPAGVDADAEVSRRAKRCMEDIYRMADPVLSAAVVRHLAWPGLARDVPAAIRVLIDFVPFAEDETVAEEVLNSLLLLSVRQPKIDPALPTALDEPLPARRGAAAYVLGSVGTEEYSAPVRARLKDAVSAVRFRAALGLVAAREADAVPALIALLGEVPSEHIGRIEDMLCRLAGQQVPADAVPRGHGAASRQQAAAAWQRWWHNHRASIDLARAGDEGTFRGLVTVCEYDSGVAGKFAGQVWEAPRHGQPRFTLGELTGPMDAQLLRNGRVLVAENGANRVTERDLAGKVHWEQPVQGGNPICCERLSNGNTFIALYNQLLEVRPDRSEVYRYMPGPQFYIFSARKTRSGTVACLTAQGMLLEVDPVRQVTLHSISLGQPAGGWGGVEPLPNGNFLVATMNSNSLREISPTGTTVWSLASPITGVFRASRLPNGNFLVASMTTREVAEIDRTGAVQWRHVCKGRPWSVHYR